MTDETQTNDQDVADAWAAALEEQDVAEEALDGEPGTEVAEAVQDENYQAAQFQDLKPEASGIPDDANLEVVLEIPVTLSMEIGRTSISIRNLLQLNQGSVVELDRLAGEPMDVLVNGTLIAHGEVVVVNEKFGIRLTDVISPTERVKKLK